MAFRKNNTYKYETGKTFKLSRSGIDSFIKCQRCFYLNKVGNIKDIGMPAFSLNSNDFSTPKYLFKAAILSNSLKNIRDSNFKIFDSGLNLHKLIQLNQSTKRELNPEGDNAMLKGYIESMSNSVNNFSTGRFEKWKSIVSYKQKITNYIFGNGPEFDRWILIGSYEHHLNDAASSILYLYLWAIN